MGDPLGLHVFVSPDGRLEKTLDTEKGMISLEPTSIADEIILFSELNYHYYAIVVDKIKEYFDNAYHEETSEEFFGQNWVDIEQFDCGMELTNELIHILAEDDPQGSLLTQLLLDDTLPEDDGTAMHLLTTGQLVVDRLTAIMRLQFLVNDALFDMCSDVPLDFENKYDYFARSGFVQICTVNKQSAEEFFFRSLLEYYRFLMMRFIASNPNVAKCQCCGKFFIPKTRKKTLYCDRILRNGKTCKELAPMLKHRRDARGNEVIQAFDRARQKMYKRYERTIGALSKTPIGITYEEYYEWLDAATKARDNFLSGVLPKEDALKIIEKG